MRTPLFVVLAVVIAVTGSAAIYYLAGQQGWRQAARDFAIVPLSPTPADAPPPAVSAVGEIVDAFTIKLETGHVVRYIGVRPPEIGEQVHCFGKEAFRANESVVGQRVRLEEELLLARASDGAWLRYVWLIQGEIDSSPAPTPAEEPEELGNTEEKAEGSDEEEDEEDIFINEAIIEGGFGFPVVAEDMVHGQRLLFAARYAKATGKGLWSRCDVTQSASSQLDTQVIDECVIKGTALPQGNVFRTPACELYGSTGVFTANNDRWFCSEAEAREAGFEAAADCSQ